ncbi:MAG: FHA domain-containing protein [Planctomycetales bacterium]|jgi:hypothetical protein
MAMILESADHSQRFPLDRESTFVGSSEWKSDICLTGPNIADVHCELTLDEQGVRVVALADCGVTVNGETVREATLSAGDELGIALLRFRLSGDAADSEFAGAVDAEVSSEAEPVAPHLSRWIVRMSGMNLGPLDWDELQTMISRGEVRLDDEVQREHESAWQALRDVLPQSGGDGLLCDDSPVEPADFVPRGRRVRQKSARTKASSDEARDAIDEPAQTEVPLAPQFFIMRGDEEVGPLPRQAIEELADDGSILSDTPVRLEESEQWSTAAAVGFHCSASMPTGLAPDVMKDPAGMNHAVGIAWLAFAPYYFVTGVARSVAGLDPRRAAKWGVAVLIVGILAFGWLRSWSQTAMYGVISLDGQPVSDVLVQLTGARTGDSAMGVSDGQGDFRVVTLDGELKPGLYLVTVRPLSEVSGDEPAEKGSSAANDVELEFPDRYRHINTTDATIEITPDQSRYTVDLTTEPKSVGGFRGGAMSASRALP